MSGGVRELRQLINRIDVVIRDINMDVYKDQKEIREELRKALLKTGMWQH